MFNRFKSLFSRKEKATATVGHHLSPSGSNRQPDPNLAADYQWVIDAAKVRFPNHEVRGMFFQDNQAYGVQISNGKKKSLLQLHAQVLIDGRPTMSDLNTQKNRDKIVAGAFDAIEKALAA